MSRTARTLAQLTIAMGIGECISAVAITTERYAGSVPAFAVLFAVMFFASAWLLRTRLVAGCLIVGILAVFEIVSYPGWQKHNTFDRAFDTAYVSLAAVTLAVAVATLVTGRRRLASS